jgi:hypothetical protein
MAVSNTKFNTPTARKAEGKPDTLQLIEDFLIKRSRNIFIGCMALTAVFGLMLFDGRLSFATDDSTYVLNALAFLKNGSYPNFQGALYPFFLALVIKLFGTKVLLLKTCSFLFILLHNYIFYRAFKGRVPYLVLFSGLIIFSINAYILAYGSSTFSEAFFLVLQSLGFLTFFKLIDKLNSESSTIQSTIKYWLIFGFVLFLMSIAKNVAVFTIFGVLAYFLLGKEWKYALLAIVFFAVFKVPYEVAVRAKYGNIGAAQVELLMRKDFNDPSKGKVDAADLSERFFTNFGQYFSVHTFKVLGMRGSGVPAIWTFDKMNELREPLAMEPNALYAFIFILLFGLGAWQAYKHSPYMLYTVIYIATVTGVTFFALHTFWNQDRLIIIYVPLIFMVFCYGCYELIKSKNYSILKPIFPIVIAIILLIQLGTTLKQTSKNSKQFKAFTKGNAFYGYPLPVANYLQVCEWKGKNVHDSLSTLAAKPVEGALFANGGSYIRMPDFPKDMNSPDTALDILKKRKVGYIIIDAFSGSTSQLAQFIGVKYPQKLQIVHQEGEQEQEPAVLVKVVY